jgi:hypothetical protein
MKSAKTCSLDSIPTALLKNNSVLPEGMQFFTELGNTSLSTGVFPDELKGALVTPRLKKKTGLDMRTFSNYRPVSNISFISKIIERIVSQQLDSHLTINGPHDDLQSAYKTGTSTETAILRIKADTEALSTVGSYIHLCDWLISRSVLFSIQCPIRSLFLNDLR